MSTVSKTRRCRPTAVLYLLMCGLGAELLLNAVAVAATGVAGAYAQGIQPLESIRAAAEKYVRAQMPASAQGITVTAGDLDSRLRLAHCAEALQAASGFGSQLQARMAVSVSCRRGSNWTVYVPVTVESEIPVLVLRNPAVAGARLTASDVAQETRRVAGLSVGYVKDVTVLEHNTLRRPMPAGAVLTADALLADFVVRQGEEVTLLAAAGGIEVRAAGKALNSGRDGDRVRAQNLGSLKIVEGVVDAQRVIHVTP